LIFGTDTIHHCIQSKINKKIGLFMSHTKNTAVIGLGSMGYGIAQSCLRAGHLTYGFDVVSANTDRFSTDGGSTGALEDIAGTLDAAVIVVLNAAQTEDVMFGEDGIAPLMRKGSVILACATAAPEFAQHMESRCSALGIHFLDAPISGGAVKAAQGNLSVLASGTPEAFTAARPVLDAAAETVFELGDTAGAGSAMKAVNQLLAGVHIATMAEALTFGMTQGVTPEKFLEVISQCAGTSWMLENRAPHVVAGDYTPNSQVNIWPKDLGIVLDIAKSVHFEAPITQAALQQFTSAADMGLGQEDDAAVAKVYARNVGLTLPEHK
jgi:3-hydroxyisobutyrate dehydrogenase-like beta-hydroxyacid dehydrogenase